MKAGLASCGAGRLRLFLEVVVVGVGCPGGFALGGGAHADGAVGPGARTSGSLGDGDHGRRRCPLSGGLAKG